MYTEHPVNKLQNHISGWYIETTLWDEIVSECNRKKILFEKETTDWRGYSRGFLHKINKSLFENYLGILDNCLNLYKQQYPFLKECPKLKLATPDSDKTVSAVKLQKYKPGKYYSELHCENDGMYPYRTLVYMTYLVDIDGGGTDFPQQQFETKSQKGLTLIWPASFTHPHIGIPAEKDTKLIMTGWWEWDLS